MVAMPRKHPLHERKNPGRQMLGDVGDEVLKAANIVLEAVETGVVEKHYVPTETRERRRPVWWEDFLKVGPVKKRLTSEQERFLANRIRVFGDIDARNFLVERNVGLVYAVSGRFAGKYRSDYDDIVHECMLGIMRAADDFDPFTYPVKFSTYASHWIFAKLQRFRQKLRQEREPVITDGGDLYEGEVDGPPMHSEERRKRRRRAPVRSLDAPTGENIGEGAETLGDMIAANDLPIDEVLVRRETEAEVRRAMDEAVKIDPRMRVIAERRLLADEPATLHEVSQLIATNRARWNGANDTLSREGARIIERKLLNAFQENFNGFVKPRPKLGKPRGTRGGGRRSNLSYWVEANIAAFTFKSAARRAAPLKASLPDVKSPDLRWRQYPCAGEG